MNLCGDGDTLYAPSPTAQSLIRNLSYVLVPFRWSRVLTDLSDSTDDLTVYYVSPSGRVLRCRDDVMKYLRDTNVCRCFLDRDVAFEEVFSFSPRFGGLALPPPNLTYESKCLKWAKRIPPEELELKLAATQQYLRDQTVNDRRKVFNLLSSHKSAENDSEEEQNKNLTFDEWEDSFPWDAVNVIQDGRIYARNMSKNQWIHAAYEFKPIVFPDEPVEKNLSDEEENVKTFEESIPFIESNGLIHLQNNGNNVNADNSDLSDSDGSDSTVQTDNNTTTITDVNSASTKRRKYQKAVLNPNKKRLVKAQTDQKSNAAKGLRCSFTRCKQTFDNESDLIAHQQSHPTRKFCCRWPDCGLSFTQKSNTLRHIREKHFKIYYRGHPKPTNIREESQINNDEMDGAHNYSEWMEVVD